MAVLEAVDPQVAELVAAESARQHDTLCLIASARGDESLDRHFRDAVWPLLLQRCVSCHGAEQQEGGLRLDSREATLQGGDHGAVEADTVHGRTLAPGLAVINPGRISSRTGARMQARVQSGSRL